VQGISFISEYASAMQEGADTSAALVEELLPDRYKASRWLIDSLLKVNFNRTRIMLVGDGLGAYLLPMLITQFKPGSVVFVESDEALVRARRIHNQAQRATQIEWVTPELISHTPPCTLVVAPRCDSFGNIGSLRVPTNNCHYVVQGSDSSLSRFPTDNVDQLLAGSGIIQFSFKESLNLNNESRHMVIGTKAVF